MCKTQLGTHGELLVLPTTQQHTEVLSRMESGIALTTSEMTAVWYGVYATLQLKHPRSMTTYVSSSSSRGSNLSGSKMTESRSPSTLSAAVSSERGPFRNPSAPLGEQRQKVWQFTYWALNGVSLFCPGWSWCPNVRTTAQSHTARGGRTI